ncbi:hypothetical protein Tco_0887440 [Tanacetum coccineum]
MIINLWCVSKFLNDKPTEEEPGKANVETEVESMVTVPIHQASSSAPPLSTPIIDLISPANKDTGVTHLPKIKTRPDWLKPADALTKTYKDPEENKLLQKTGDMGSFIKWYCKQIRNSKLVKADLEGPAYKRPPVRNIFKHNTYFHKELVISLVRVTNELRNALSIYKLKMAYYPDFGLEEFVPSLWIKSERDYDISATYGISHRWFKSKEFYITRHSALSDHRIVRSHMRILSVVSLKTFSRYGYTYLRKIVLRRADYKEYKISEADFKNLHPNDF